MPPAAHPHIRCSARSAHPSLWKRETLYFARGRYATSTASPNHMEGQIRRQSQHCLGCRPLKTKEERTRQLRTLPGTLITMGEDSAADNGPHQKAKRSTYHDST